MNCWTHLGIEPTHDTDAIRRAYRARLPQHHPETDPRGFQALREAYELASRHAHEDALEADRPADDGLSAGEGLLADFQALLLDSTRRFNPEAWRVFNLKLDQVSLEVLDEVCWPLLHQLFETGPISHACVRLLVQRMGWTSRVLDLDFDNARHVDEFLQRIEAPDPFDTSLLSHWPPAAQLEALWYARTLDHLYDDQSFDDYRYFVSLHTCVPLPADDHFLHRLAIQFSQAGIASQMFLEMIGEHHQLAPQDVDWLYLLARQRSALNLEELALQAWVQLWQQHQHPKAAIWLLELCAHHQPQRLPLLIQAFDRLENFRDWSGDLDDVTQEYGSPSQRPETLARWFHARQLDLPGMAGAFVEWRVSGDELPLLACLVDTSHDPQLQHLYQHAWALHRGDVPLLQRIMNAAQNENLLDQLVMEGFKYQADQQICWLTQAPIPLVLKAFVSNESTQPVLPPELQKGEPLKLCLLWTQRLRQYDTQSLARLNEVFDPGKRGATHRALYLQVQLAEQGMLVPAVDKRCDVWEWHRQALYLLSTLDQPARWLRAQSAACLDSMNVVPEHPLARLQPLFRQLQWEQGGISGLLGWLKSDDPVHALLARQLLGVQEALDSTRLLSNERLIECMRSDINAFDDDLLGRMLLCGVLYHDPLLDVQQRKYLLEKITEIICPQDWFDGFRHGLIKGEPQRPPQHALDDEGAAGDAFYLALDVFKKLVLYGNAGVPRQKTLLRMQRAKDNFENGLGLRCVFSALLSWSERLLLAGGDRRPAPAAACWRLDSRLGRRAFFWQVAGGALVTPLAALLSGTLLSGVVVLLLGVVFLLSAVLRRLHDVGRGIPTLMMLVILSTALPFLTLSLFVWPGEKLPNRYGAPPDDAAEEALSGGLQAALRRLDG